jgi:excinuclease ABC subunit B
MRRTIDETNRRREKQLTYNAEHGITPTQIYKSHDSVFSQATVGASKGIEPKAYIERESLSIAADPVMQYMTREQLDKTIATAKRNMDKAAKDLDFTEAARYRDEMFAIQLLYEERFKK